MIPESLCVCVCSKWHIRGMTFHPTKGIQHIHTTLYYPKSNGGVECFDQSLKNNLRVHLAQGYTFKQAIHFTLLHYWASQHSTTGASPASLILGKELNLPLDRLHPSASQRLP